MTDFPKNINLTEAPISSADAPQAALEAPSASSVVERLLTASGEKYDKLVEQLNVFENGGLLSDHEIAVSRAFGWISGDPDLAHLRLGDFQSKKVLQEFISRPSRGCSTEFLLSITTDRTQKKLWGYAVKGLKIKLINDSDEFSACLRAAIEVVWGETEDKNIADWIRNISTKIGFTFSIADSAWIFDRTYARLDASGRITSSFANLMCLVLPEITRGRDEIKFGEVLRASSDARPGSIGNVLKSTKKLPLAMGTPKEIFCRSVLLIDDRNLVNGYAQESVLSDWNLLELGCLVRDQETLALIQKSQKVFQTFSDEVKSRVRKKAAFADVLSVITTHPVLIDFGLMPLIIERARRESNLLLLGLLESGRNEGAGEFNGELQNEILAVKSRADLAEKSVANLLQDLELEKAQVHELTRRLKAAVGGQKEIHESQKTMAVFDILRDLIDFIELVDTSRESVLAIQTAINAQKANLSKWGIEVLGQLGMKVQFDASMHMAGNGPIPNEVILKGPVYIYGKDSDRIVLRKARVDVVL
jgi:hypothetical protein